MSVTEREAILRAAMEAGCDEAERLGYGSQLGYVEATSIGEKAATVALDQLAGAASMSRDDALWLIGQIQGDTSATATNVRAKLLAYLTASGGQ